ncbi:Glucose-1-phosphate thymidylyltransferase [hydrothermal vent metagenome]|uniref:Glucose-1-phosphate thymidylyltransferase n=1 Tax=hydrothermal vent metagenome TaxID=652676 RepID=A0A3B0XQ52_9ZZZZ
MRPLTDIVPKPLIRVSGRYLIEYHLYNLASAGFTDVVINVAWLGQKIIQALGNGEKYSLNIVYSDEGAAALETGGGIYRALPLLSEQFLVINGDVWTDYPLDKIQSIQGEDLAHLVLVNNPVHNPEGDFALSNGRLVKSEKENYTFSGIGIYTKAFFESEKKGKYPLAPMIRHYIEMNKISGERYRGQWMDIGTQQRLSCLVDLLSEA